MALNRFGRNNPPTPAAGQFRNCIRQVQDLN